MADRIQLTIKHARIAFPNFAGSPTKYVREGGKKTFCVILDEETGKNLAKDGWNIKWFKVREGEEKEPRRAFMEVVVNYNARRGPQIIMLIENENFPPRYLTEETVLLLDHAEIVFADMILNGFRWTQDEMPNLKPYLNKMYVTVRQDELDKMYREELEEPAYEEDGE